jgi:tetratricopeptide (TPR) repeat protein
MGWQAIATLKQYSVEGLRWEHCHDRYHALSMTGRSVDALATRRTGIRVALSNERGDHLAITLRAYGVSKRDLNRLAEALHAIHLALEVAQVQVVSDEKNVTSTHLALMWQYLYRGQWEAANTEYAAFVAGPQPSRALYRPGMAEEAHVWLQFWQGTLSGEVLEQAFAVAERAHSRQVVRALHRLRGEWLFAQGRLDEAADAWHTVIAMALPAGIPVADAQAQLACVLATARQQVEARLLIETVLEQTPSGTLHCPHCVVAETYMRLGDREQARAHALQAYRHAWADGPPHSWWWALKRTRAVLAELGESEPVLPRFDPSWMEPVPYEDEIRTFVAERRPYGRGHAER